MSPWTVVTIFVLVVVAVIVVYFGITGEDDYTRRERYIGAYPGLCEITRVTDKEFLITIKPEVPSWVAFDPGVLLQGLRALAHNHNIDYFVKIMTVTAQDNPEHMSVRNGYRVFVSPLKS